jgi:hypothetical protein
MSTRFGGAAMQVHTVATIHALVTFPAHIARLGVVVLVPIFLNRVPSSGPPPPLIDEGDVRMVVLHMLHNFF